jgi:DNA-binding response OmpR family regulator
MARPTLLIAEPEPAHALSARKLVMETAKFNVITAHSGKEALDLFRRFPEVDGVVVHSELRDVSASDIFGKVKQKHGSKPTILLMSGVQRSRTDADYTLPSDEPQELLDLVRELFGDPR